MITLAILPHQGQEEYSKPFASNNLEYKEYIDYLKDKYANELVEYAYIIEGTNKVRLGVFDQIPQDMRQFTNFEQFVGVARRKRF